MKMKIRWEIFRMSVSHMFFSSFLLKWWRNNVLWRHFSNYFPIKFVKTVDLNPTKTYFFIYIPHGVLAMGMLGCFGLDVTQCKKLFPGLEIRSIALDLHFKAPFTREYFYMFGISWHNSLLFIKSLLCNES